MLNGEKERNPGNTLYQKDCQLRLRQGKGFNFRQLLIHLNPAFRQLTLFENYV